ncbi:hypothetical protein [Metapseudomonas otitidis]|uniref:hypothetical protein n=1 Tax=Metapseudomonas otitidis TaxID=319939 RepID=UPI002449F441|nr:hypothetical protein [Pseudomonas otitidis]MDG9784666.1 hypothetical protein [Pseudomonas otitidis]
MNALEIARDAVESTSSAAPFVSAETRELMAFGRVAMLIERLNENDSVRVYRLEEALHEVRHLLAA